MRGIACCGPAARSGARRGYGEGAKPLLTTNGRTEVIRLFDCSYVTVAGPEITAPNGGWIFLFIRMELENG